MVLTISAQEPEAYADENARVYLQALQSSCKPEIRPNFGRWEPIVKLLEEVFDDVKEHDKRGRLVAQTLQSMIKTKKYPGLADLLKSSSSTGNITIPQQGEGRAIPALPHYAQLPPALSIGACPELDLYEQYSRKASDRAFDGYHVFCGLWLFSVIAARRVYAQIKRKKFHSNLMIALCARTSLSAKSFTANVAKDFLYELGLDHLLTPNKITPQRLLSEMSGQWLPGNYDELSDERKAQLEIELAMPGQRGMLFDELGKFIQNTLRKSSTSSEFIDLLLELDACPPEYRTATITRGGEPVTQPYLSILGNMTPANLKEIARAGADGWSDGWWARMSFVVAPPPDEEDESDPGPPQAEGLSELPPPWELVQALQAWHERLGVPVCTIEQPASSDEKKSAKPIISREELPETLCILGPGVEQAWLNYEYGLRHLCKHLPNEDLNGSYVRLAETAMRIAVIFGSLSNNNRVEMRHWAKAQELTEQLRVYLHDLYAQVNAGDIEKSVEKTIEEKILSCVGKLSAKGTPPNVRDLTRYIKGPSSGVLQAIVNDLVRIHELVPQQMGRTIRYTLGLEE